MPDTGSNPDIPATETSPVENSNTVSQEAPVQPSQPETPEPVSPEPEKKKLPWFVFAIPVVLILAFVLYYFYPKISQLITKKVTPEGGLTQVEPKDGLPNSWINCGDIRQVINDNGTLYFGCLGGVLIVDKASGEVKGQISEADGLGNSTVTSLIKKGDILYIGTQDGFTKFDLVSRTAKKISVKEGLVNGANIELHEDGDNLWVATFNGVSLYDEKTEKITNYTKEIDPASVGFEVNEILTTKNAVYFITLANVNSPGAVSRYDKATSKWEYFGPSAFGVTGQYARIDFYNLTEFEGKIYVGDYNAAYWSAEDKVGTTWAKVDGLVEAVRKDQASDSVSIKVIGKDKSGLLVLGGYGFYRYTPVSNKLEVILKDKTKFENMNFIGLDNEGAGWIKTNNDSSSWVQSVDLISGVVTGLSLKDRPGSFYKSLALIDEEPLLLADSSLWKYSIKTAVFEMLPGIKSKSSDMSSLYFLPILGTSKVLLFEQVCGQGCDLPSFYTLDYSTNMTDKIVMPKEIENLIVTHPLPAYPSSPEITPVWQDSENGLFAFKYAEKKYLQYDLLSNIWKENNSLQEGGEKIFSIYDPNKCNPNYKFASNGNKFQRANCSDAAENERYKWEIKEGSITQTEKSTNAVITLNPPATDQEYSPFENFNRFGVSRLMYTDNKLWSLSNAGLGAYNPEDATWKLYTTKEGLTRNKIQDLLVGDKYLWVLAEWGGLSAIAK